MTATPSRSSPWPAYEWPQGRQSAFCFTVDVDAESPLLWNLRETDRSPFIGQYEQRLFGPRTGIWRLLDLLDRFGIKGSFFVPGVVAERYPELLPSFVQRGHEVGLHGYFHEIVSHVSDEEFGGALDASIDIFRKQVGFVPKGFRSPAWEMTPHMLAEFSRHVASTTVRYQGSTIPIRSETSSKFRFNGPSTTRSISSSWAAARILGPLPPQVRSSRAGLMNGTCSIADGGLMMLTVP